MKLIVLDRDGVINHDSDAFIKSPGEWRPLDGSIEAIARLTKAGWQIVVATNQSGIARGLFDPDTLTVIHAEMHRTVREAGGRIDAIFFCPHGPDDDCRCRKPRPGMFEEILARYDARPENVLAVGDSLRDLQAADHVGCRPVLVLTGKGSATLTAGGLPPATIVRADLAALADELAR